ncbi:hypothetical protein LTR08_007228 [Meristemomyces frigidus]|nr:hypothetical protein LTR08_007228 [Meristemomyces frigidus]
MSAYHLLPSQTDDTQRPSRETERLPLSGFVDRDGYGPRPESRQSNTSDTWQPDIEKSVPKFRVYKQRWFGLAQLSLVTFIIGWDSITVAAISTSAAEYFGVSVDAINWLGTAGSFAFLVPIPIVIYVLNKSGPKMSILIASALVLAGNWIRYAGTRVSSFSTVMVGQVLIGIAQPFVLSAPTTYSKLWFTQNGRTTATAIATLANPLGAAVGSIVGVYLAEASGISGLMLYTSIISSVACIPGPFIPAAPPSPPSAAAAMPQLGIIDALRRLSRNLPFYLMLISFSLFLAAFQATSTLVNQIIQPYGFSEINAAVAGSLQVLVGLVTAAAVSPILDRTNCHLLVIKIVTPIIAVSYLALAFIPQTHSVAGIYLIFSFIGAASFSLTPGALEFQAAWTHPVSPEISSTLCWGGGQLLSALFIIIMDTLAENEPSGGQPAGSLFRGLVFQAIVVWGAVPCALLTGVWIFKRPSASVVGSQDRQPLPAKQSDRKWARF